MPYTLQFVVLHHVDIASPHFDLLFETAPGSPLFGIRLSRWPIRPDTSVEISSIHRRAYLIYEGKVSGDRGSVSRIAAGFCRLDGAFVELEDGQRLPMDPSANRS